MDNRRRIEHGRAICRPELSETHPPRLGMAYERSNNTPLSLSAGRVLVNCEICALAFLKPVAWAKRVARHYCSHACTGIGKRDRRKIKCEMCNTQMLVTPAHKGTTCSALCSAALKSKLDPLRPRDEFGQKYARGVRPNAKISGCTHSAALPG